MIIIRPITQGDFSALKEIAVESGIGFTSLPCNDEQLQNKIDNAEASFTRNVTTPGNEGYLFVMEDTETGEVLGTSGIEATVGLNDAFYNYHLSKVVHASRELDVHNTVDILTLCNDYTGISELCTLFLREKARKGLNGRLMSKMRFLFMMEHRTRFADTIIAEMRGVSDENGKSPFWAWLEEHFFSMDFPTADYLTGIGNKVFIAELMPKYPIYVSLLSPEAQAVIGKVHDKTRPALRLLEQEGFSCRGYVDIFDAGPTVEANINSIRTAQASRKLPVTIDDEINYGDNEYFAINTDIVGFRATACKLTVDEDNGRVIISQQTANALNVSENDSIRFAPARIRG